MEIINKYIPREYLALKINYCRQRLSDLPGVKMYKCKEDGVRRDRVIYENHRYSTNSERGRELYRIWELREDLECKLDIYESIWRDHFRGSPPEHITPCKVERYLTVGYQQRVLLNKEFFDSLKNDDNTKYLKHGNYYFDGIYYRSAAEKEIAMYYTEQGIPFKYEPSITLFGLSKPINTDFVIYIEELDTCIFHEHFGIKNSIDYARISKIKYGNYIEAGLIPEEDILFTFDTNDVMFDIRMLEANLNGVVYCKMLSGRNQYGITA